MTQLHRHDLARPDATIRYWTGGADDAPTVVFLHGATLDHRAWHPQTDALRPRFHVIAPDLRGHGSSTGRFDFDRRCPGRARPPGSPCPARRSCWSGSASAPTSPRRSSTADPTSSAGSSPPTPPATPPTATHSPRQPPSPPCGSRPCGQATSSPAKPPAPPPPTHRSRTTSSRSTPTGPTKKPSTSSPACSPTHCNPTRATGCPCPHCSCTDSSTTSATSPPTCGHGPDREPLARYAVIPDAGHASNLDNPAVFTNLLVEFIDQLPPTADTEPPPDLSDEHRTQECLR